MATGSFPTARDMTRAMPHRDAAAAPLTAWDVMRGLGSLKITVSMFLAAIFLLFVGTLAQDEMNLPEVKAAYFNSWVARIPFSDFFPVTIFGPSRLTGWFPFPGGATIGLVLLVNLIAAKITRFHVAASGRRLAAGTAIAVLGGLLTLFVVLTGHRTDGLQGRPPVEYDTVWRMVQGGAVLLAIACTAGAVVARRRLVRVALGGGAVALAALAGLAIFGGADWRMNDPGLRIMWQLIQSSGAALVLLAGLVMVFGHRGGNMLIHIAVGLLMVGQFVFGDRQIEERMTLLEGQTSNVAFRTDETELAIIDEEDPETEHVTVIADRLLRSRVGGEPIAVEGLPFTIEVLEYHLNSSVAAVGQAAAAGGPPRNPATTGLGTRFVASSRPPEGGASSQPNIASAYVRLRSATGTDLGTFLVSQFLNDQGQIFMAAEGDRCDTVRVDDRPWRLQLRYRREYKPYAVTLDDVRKVDYAASDTPRDYSSYVTFTDRDSGAEQKGRIWMNNPVRYRGETFYQSQYSKVDLGGGRTGEMTGLQVVENAGWLVPYVACVLAFWGMLVHFGGTFLRFADRHERGPLPGVAVSEAAGPRRARRGRREHPVVATAVPPHSGGRAWLPAALAVALVAAVALPRAWQRPPADRFDWLTVGTLPVMHEGRVKPFDTVARNLLQLLGNRTSVTMPADGAASPGRPQGTVPASQWLLAHMAGSDWVDQAPVFRIDAAELLDLFDLQRRQGHRYAAAELAAGRPALRAQIEAARDVPADQRTFLQKKCGEINQKLMAYDLVRFAYETPALPALAAGDDAARREMVERIRRLVQGAEMLENNHPPAVIPPLSGEPGGATDGPRGRWQAVYPAVVSAVVARMLAGQPGQPAYELNPALLPFTSVLTAADESPETLAKAVADFRTASAGLPAARDSADRAAFEAWFNAFNPTDIAKWLYALAMVVCFASFLAWHGPLNRFVWGLLLATLLLHTFALAARIAITGRPPVVNLYSSAVFIGWACVLAGLGLEAVHRMGIGNLVAALGGFLTLQVAYGLDTGDTMHVLQAVLDTQFWLSTHVVTVTLGYGATFLAGLLGTCAIVHRVWTDRRGTAAGTDAAAVQDRLYRMTYGVVCFALFFSFIGTVLGGLWADDSWGRFWGWDPKENGALMIVLWNAAALHARWDKWIGQRGFALFAIGGNIVTAWSWFGTNQLGIGLHSYGFTSGVLMLLAGYVLSQLILIAAAVVLTRRGGASAPVASGLR